MEIMNKQQIEGLRFNEGKTRYDLIPPFAQEQYARVLTLGAQKYAERNWEKGMPWSKIVASLERHLYAYKRGEDFDKETGLLHAAHIMCNAGFLTEYYQIHPEGDDRPSLGLGKYRTGIDIDDVLADFISAYCERFGVRKPNTWDFDPMFSVRYKELLDDEKFWTTLKPILTPKDLPFQPIAYITARPEVLYVATAKWLFETNNYPVAPIIFTNDKLKACNDLGINRFVDDKVETFLNLNKNKVLCYLFDAFSNQYLDVGFKRINKETIKNFL
jgi:hypothetical protein